MNVVFYGSNIQILPVSVAAPSAAAHMLGFRVRVQPEAWMSVVIYCYKSLRRADHSSRGVIPNVMCPVSVIVGNQRGGLDPLGSLESWEKYSSIGFEFSRIFLPFCEIWDSYSGVADVWSLLRCDAVFLGE